MTAKNNSPRKSGMSVEKAVQIVTASINKLVQKGWLNEADAKAYLDAVSKVPTVGLAFDIGLRAMRLAYDQTLAAAEANLSAIATLPKGKEVMVAKGEWLNRLVAEANEFAQAHPLKSALPAVKEEFTPQSLSKVDREAFEGHLVNLAMVTWYGRCRRPGCKKHAQWDPRKGMFYPHCQVDFKAANEAKRRAQEAERRDRPAQVWVVPEPENTTPPASKQQPKVTAAPAIPATGGSRVKVSEVLAALKAQEDAPDVTYTPRRRPGRKGHNPREAVEG